MSSTAWAATIQGRVAAGCMKGMGSQASVPVTIKDVNKLASGELSITAPSPGNDIYYSDITFTDAFNGSSNSIFNGFSKMEGEILNINFVSNGNKDHKIASEVVCHITYKFSGNVSPGVALDLQVTGVALKDSNGSQIPVDVYHGKVERGYMLGDAVGNDSVTPLSAVRILQHAGGSKLISDAGAREAVDLDANGEITENDAILLLNYLTGLKDNFFTVKTATLNKAIYNQNYSVILEAAYGESPYTWAIIGRLPAGLKLDTSTGEIAGKPTRLGTGTFTVRVTDRDVNRAERQFTIEVIETNIASVENIGPISVSLGEEVALPAQINVTYRDGTGGMENVTWEPVDTATVGTKTARGSIGGPLRI